MLTTEEMREYQRKRRAKLLLDPAVRTYKCHDPTLQEVTAYFRELLAEKDAEIAELREELRCR
jgi:hypothetical protein